ILIVGPKFITAGQNFSLVISNFGPESRDVTFKINGVASSGRNILSLSKPAKVSATSNTTISLILNKPVFKPGDTVQFRAIVLNRELRPPAEAKSAHIIIRDPLGNVIRRWASGTLRTGVFEGDVDIATIPLTGLYTISVWVGEEEIGSKTFEVKEYALALFDVQLQPKRVPLVKHQALSLSLTAKYYVGKPVKGIATLDLYLDDDNLDQQKVVNVHGAAHVDMFFKKPLKFEMNITQKSVEPGKQLEINMRGRPGAYVALAAYDQSLLQHSSTRELFWQDIVNAFDGFHAMENNGFDDFDSWLWKTDTIDHTGSKSLKEVAPDTTTAWHLTGFSIDPEYGLGIIKQPIEFTTVQSFYIVANLPYSIKRGEIVTLQFILFSNYPKQYKASVTLYTNILTPVLDNSEKLLSVPVGCGEQNMIRLVPTVMVLDYLTSIGETNTRAIKKATDLLRKGYRHQIRYRRPDGSFAVFPRKDGSVFLTAFVAKTLATASKYISEVQPYMIREAFSWLAAKQQYSGRFDEVSKVFHKDMQGGLREGIALTSFVLIALQEQADVARQHEYVIKKGIDYVARTLPSIEDSYDLAIATYALCLNGHSSHEAFLDKLISKSTTLYNGMERYWSRHAHEIETTAYALLSYVKVGKFVDGTAIMRWLVKQRFTPASFPRTQDTFVGLRALTAMREKVSSSRNDYTVQLRADGLRKEFRVRSYNLGTVQHADVIGDTSHMAIEVNGVGFGLLQVTYEYGVDLRNFTNSFDLRLTKTLSNSGGTLKLRVCASFVPKAPGSRSNMALVEVNFPSGYAVERNPVYEDSYYKRIQNTEVRFGGTSVVLYYNNMGTEQNCFTVTAFRKAKIALKRPAYVLVHDYYEPRKLEGYIHQFLMWRYVRSSLLVIVLAITVCHGILIVGPKFITAGQNFSLVISNFGPESRDVTFKINGVAADGKNILSLSKPAKVAATSNAAISITLPTTLPAGSYNFAIDGQNGFKFHQAVELVHVGNTLSALIQLSKPVFKPGDTVQFRAIVLNRELRPPAEAKSAHIIIRDPLGNVIRRWASATLRTGVFEGDVDIATIPLTGMYTISVWVGEEEIGSKAFEVKEYALALFDVQLQPKRVPLVKHQALSLSLTAKYYVGKPVKGTATLELYLEDERLDQRRVLDVYGAAQVDLQFNDRLNEYGEPQTVRVDLTFTQDETNHTIFKQQQITMYESPYLVELHKEQPEFDVGKPYRCFVRLQYHDGSPAKAITAQVKVERDGGGTRKTSYTSDDDGMIKLLLNPTATTQMLLITVTIDDQELLFEQINGREPGKAFIKLYLSSKVVLGEMINLQVTCNTELPFFLYYVISKGNIVDSGYVKVDKLTEHLLQISATHKMIPKAQIMVATMSGNVVLYDFVNVNFDDLRNNFEMNITQKTLEPGKQLEINMRGRPGAYVALAAYDQSLLQHSSTHDLFWQDIVNTFDGLNGLEYNEFDHFHVRIDSGARAGMIRKRSTFKLSSFRTNFVESWLWKTDTIDQTGSKLLKEVAPDTTTAWHLTGFSIDPEYGLGIIKQPIEFTTVQSFYIVANLPYSIKRGEIVTLQFILFSNYPKQYKASVTLYSVDNQTEFIGRSTADTSYTKTVTVSQDTGVPISFFVKARKLGEMTVRVTANIDPAEDTIETVVRVQPENMMVREMVSRFFSHTSYRNQVFDIELDIDRKAVPGSRKVDFVLTPNILTSVLDNLESLLSVPTGCGEQNMMRLVPIVLVLDYLTSLGTANKQLTDKATGLLRKGYQNQMRYRRPDGSFAVFERNPGSVFLTAFVAKTLATASKYISEVQPDMVQKSYKWLAEKQHSSGRFDEVGQVWHKDMQGGLRNGIALTSFVLIALQEQADVARQHEAVIKKGIDYVARTLPSIEDSYDLAIATYALSLNGHSSHEAFLKRLIGKSTPLSNETERYWSRQAHEIETTAYALLSFVKTEKFVDGTAIMRWLVKQRYTPGSFPRTQDTFVGLKALTALAEKISPSRNEYSVQLRADGLRKEFRVTSEDLMTLQHADVIGDTNHMTLNVSGIGFGLLQVAYEYGVDLRNFTNSFELRLSKTLSNSGGTLKLRVCASFVPQLSDTRSNMALVEVNFPSGYAVERNPISDESNFNPIQKTEVRFGGTSVVLYYNNMGTEQNCFTVTAFRKAKIALKRPAYVLVHDYYEPQFKAIAVYQVDDDVA
uniref:TEP1-F n=1 Tax=Anopheles dirus TaxID=7168 RepID=A0A182NVA1_9DIPT